MVKILFRTAALMIIGLFNVMASSNQFGSMSQAQKLALQQQLLAGFPKQQSMIQHKQKPHRMPRSNMPKNSVQEPVPMPDSPTQKTFQSGDGSSLYFRR